MKKLTIAIDGPAGAGKSTVAQIVAGTLNYTYIDTGAMYRAVTWLAIANNITSDKVLINYAREAVIRLAYINGKTKVFVNGTDVTDEIRTPEISRKVAEIAQIPAIREVLIAKQREMAQEGGVVMDGRDIGSYVLPNADVKLFLTASIEERARRRWQELTEKGIDVSLQDIANDITCRDKQDCEREIAPLKKTEDAILIDTTGITIQGTVQKILDICRERAGLV
ncbi:MAG: (d)CMP kinase [Veillonellaceae bacterium]|nr:(d)CMP kinase [Veillonellaceae bacterium]